MYIYTYHQYRSHSVKERKIGGRDVGKKERKDGGRRERKIERREER